MNTVFREIVRKKMPAKNVLGKPLEPCCFDPVTGYYRDGYCRTGPGDFGVHSVCAEMTVEFLEFSKKVGNDLSTPIPEHDFPGLVPGDCWCVCAARWQEAFDAGIAPPVHLASTHVSAIEFASMEALLRHATDKPLGSDDPDDEPESEDN